MCLIHTKVQNLKMGQRRLIIAEYTQIRNKLLIFYWSLNIHTSIYVQNCSGKQVNTIYRLISVPTWKLNVPFAGKTTNVQTSYLL